MVCRTLLRDPGGLVGPWMYTPIAHPFGDDPDGPQGCSVYMRNLDFEWKD